MGGSLGDRVHGGSCPAFWHWCPLGYLGVSLEGQTVSDHCVSLPWALEIPLFPPSLPPSCVRAGSGISSGLSPVCDAALRVGGKEGSVWWGEDWAAGWSQTQAMVFGGGGLVQASVWGGDGKLPGGGVADSPRTDRQVRWRCVFQELRKGHSWQQAGRGARRWSWMQGRMGLIAGSSAMGHTSDLLASRWERHWRSLGVLGPWLPSLLTPRWPEMAPEPRAEAEPWGQYRNFFMWWRDFGVPLGRRLQGEHVPPFLILGQMGDWGVLACCPLDTPCSLHPLGRAGSPETVSWQSSRADCSEFLVFPVRIALSPDMGQVLSPSSAA